MSEEIIARYGDKVRIVTKPPRDVIVQVWGGAGWHNCKTFDANDDYAFTSAREAARRVADSMSNAKKGKRA
jgi:hypothetical protein